MRVGTIPIPTGTSANVRVIVRLSLPPLAAREGRGLYAFGASRKLDLHSISELVRYAIRNKMVEP